MAQTKAVVVTGSTSGIGQGVAESFASAGFNVMLNGFGDAEAIETQRQGLEKTYGIRALYSDADMTDPSAIGAMIRHAVAEFSTVDVLVNNAGIQHVNAVEDFPPEKWDAVLAINLSSAFHTTHHAVAAMKQRGWGRVINIASAHGLVASPNKAAYVAAKHGIIGLTKVVALETAGTGVTANAICPGWVLTPLVRQQIEKRARESGRSFEDEQYDLLAEKQPSGEFVSVEEIGALAVYLSGDMARSITGAAISMDGGWTAR